jgi:type I restriction enzyme S subunit
MLPKGWKSSTLGEIARISSGGTPDRSKPKYWGGDVPWVTTGEIQFNTITGTTEKITAEGLQNSSAKLFPAGTLLMAMYGQGKTRGQVAKLGIEAATNQACAAILLNKNNDPDFYYQYLSSQYEELRELSNAGTQKNLSGRILKGVSVPVPSYPEQCRIAKILSTWDQAIATAERLLANSRKQRTALLTALVSGRQRLSSCESKWIKTTLQQVASIVVSSVNKKHVSGERQIRLCNYTDVYYNNRITGQLKFMDATATEAEIAKCMLRVGDVLITKDSETADDIAVSAYVCEEIPNLVCGYHLAIVRPDRNQVEPVFLHAYFSLASTRGYFTSNANGVTRFGLPIGAIQEAPIHLPPIAEQRRIASLLSICAETIQYQLKELDSLRSQKAALMSQLLTGKRRVKLPDVKTEEQA